MTGNAREKKTLFRGWFGKVILAIALLVVVVVIIDNLGEKSSSGQNEQSKDSSTVLLSDKPPLITAVLNVNARVVGTFSRDLLGSNILWTDNGCGAIDSNFDLKPDVLSALKRVDPPLLRYPGGLISGTYVWRNGIGPYASRGESPNADNVAQTINFGTNEYFNLLQRLNANALITLGTGISPEDAVDWYQYINKLGETNRVTYWEFGNETFLPGDPSFTTADKYIAAFKGVADALKAADPSISFGAILEASLIGVNFGHFIVPEIATWNDKVIQETKDKADFYALHLYAPGGGANSDQRVLTRKEGREVAQSALIAPVQMERNIQAIKEKLKKYASPAKLLVTEFNLGFSNTFDMLQYLPSLTQANYVAQNLMLFARQGISAATFYSLLNDYMFGQVTTDKGWPEVRSAGLVYESLASWADSELLAVSIQNPPPALPYQPRGMLGPGLKPALLDLTLLRRKSDQKLLLVVINRSVDLGAYLKIEFTGTANRPSPVVDQVKTLYQGAAELLSTDPILSLEKSLYLSGDPSHSQVVGLPPYLNEAGEDAGQADGTRIVPISPADVVMITFK